MKVIAVWENDNIEAELDCQSNSILKVKVLPFNRMPEMYTKDGHQLILAYDVEPLMKDGYISFKPPKTSEFSLVQLPKGSIIDYQGRITTPNDMRGPGMETVKNVDYSQKNRRIFTLNSYDYTPTGRDSRTDLLDIGLTAFLGDLGGFYDLHNALQDYIKKGIANPNRAISSYNAVWGLVVIVADMEISKMDAEMNEFHAQLLKKELEEAKKKGIDEVKKVAKKSQNANLKYGKKTQFLDKGAFQYEIQYVTENTVEKIMKGDFKNFEDMINFRDQDILNNPQKIAILYKVIGGGDLDEDTYIIETFFY